MRSLSSGVIVGVAFMHLMVDANEILSELSEYPLSYLLTLVGFFFTLAMEHVSLCMLYYILIQMQ